MYLLKLYFDHGSVLNSKMPKFAAKYGLHHTWERTLPIRNGSHACMCTMCTCSGLKILMNGELTAFPLCNILCQQVQSLPPPPQALRFSQGRGERLVMSRKGPWEGYKRARERDVWVRGRCEAMFSTEQLRIFKCTWIKCLLETNVASSVKPSIVTGYITYDLFIL